MKRVRDQIFWGVVVVCVAASAYGGMWYAKNTLGLTKIDPYERTLAALAGCASSRSIVTCAAPFVPLLLDERPAKELVDAVRAMRLPANQCHYVVHIIGREVYRRTQDISKSLEQCSRFCNSACPHGVIAEAFKSQYGVRDDQELQHASADRIFDESQRLCTDRNTCHGIGHALVIVYGEVDAALSTCGEVAHGIPLQDCYRGAYMEYADQLNDRSLWLDRLPEFPSVGSMTSFCDKGTDGQAAACFYYSPLILRQAYRSAGVDEEREVSARRLIPICLSLTEQKRRTSCILGYGVTFYQLLQTDEAAALAVCREFEKVDDEIACMAGMFSLSIEYGRIDDAMRYCADLVDGYSRSTCYRAIFEKAESLSWTIDDTEKSCPPGDRACAESAETVRMSETREFF